MPNLLSKPTFCGNRALWFCLFLIHALATAPPSQAQVDVLTQRYDNAHSGCNLSEQVLNPSTVNAKRFGKLFSREVDGEIYAQPLVVSRLAMPGGGQKSVVFVATEHNSVYAFDANDPQAERPFWHVNLGHPVPTRDVGSACGVYSDISHEVGITGTPVIDAQTHTLYLVARTKDLPRSSPPAKTDSPSSPAPKAGTTAPQLSLAATSPSDAGAAPSSGIGAAPASTDIAASRGFHQYLHAIDIVTGKEKPGSPVEIRAQVPGTGAGSVKGVLAFNPRIHNQRAALLLHQGVVYVCWAGHCDTGPYHGWLMGYNAHTLKQSTVFCTTPNGLGAGIWQSGGGPSVDERGNIFLVTGNGTVDADRPLKRHTEYGSSLLRLKINQGRVQVADSFTPYNYTSLNDSDLDTGSTSVLMVPGTNLVAAGSKAGVLYVLDKNHLGGFNAFSDQQIVQKLAVSQGFLYSTPVVWKRPGQSSWLYSWGMDDRLKAFELRQNQLVPVPGSAAPALPGSAAPALLRVGTSKTRFPAGGKAASFNPLPVSQSDQTISAPRPGGMLSLSTNGNEQSSAILWSLQPSGDANTSVAPGILRAFDAIDLSHELWNSNINSSRDGVGLFAKFCPPVVANGRVYVASFSNQLNVYGLNPPAQVPTPVISSRTGTVQNFVTIDNDEPRAVIRYTLDGTTPTSSSPRYRTPFLADSVELITARAFAKGELPSALASTVITDPRPDAPGSGLIGNYFPSRDLSGEPLVRLDDGVYDNPVPAGISPQGWSGRWTGQVQATQSGTYTFSTNTDDGARLWVNDKLLIDDWNVHGATRNSATIELQAGRRYPLVMEYFQSGLGAACQLMWTPPGEQESPIPKSQLHAAPDPDFIGQGTGLLCDYYLGTNLDGQSAQRVDAGVNNNPTPPGIPVNNWSARWRGQVQATRTGTFSFTTNSDDGVRLWVNDQLLIDDWAVHGAKEDTGTIKLEKGQKYSLVMEYFQGESGFAYQLMWASPGQPKIFIPTSQLYPQADADVVGKGDGLLASYFKGTQLKGGSLQRVDAQVDDATHPRPSVVPATQWSARWTGWVLAPRTGNYTFITNTDDGARLRIGDKLVIDDWNVHGAKENAASVQLVKGKKYPISLEYFQGDYDFGYQLLWVAPGQPKTLIPQSQLYSHLSANSTVATGNGSDTGSRIPSIQPSASSGNAPNNGSLNAQAMGDRVPDAPVQTGGTDESDAQDR